ncbi:MAG TPA: TraB/GumN family protein [Sphingomicrobium sp.]|jgi:uncharacterized protein YbaP (TraB family)|nr:TraB/GumN family protein [Sphingomicrobium sp.]
MIRSILRRAFAALGASLLIVGTAPAAAKPHVAKPALWAVSDADTTIYLFGTIHLLPDNYSWRTATFDKAITGSQQLIVETIVDEKNPQEMMSALAGLAFTTQNLPPLAERVPPEKRAALAAAIKKAGMPPASLDRMETWAAAFMLLGNQFRDLGLKTGEGVEQVLRSTFASQGKPVGQLETNREQLSFFDALPEAAQRALLEGAIEQPDAMGRDFDRMLSAWVRGDVGAIARTFNHDLAASPALRDALLKRRNLNWSQWVDRRMAAPGSIMIAVGAGHLAGHDSLVELLKREGYRVRRVQ